MVPHKKKSPRPNLFKHRAEGEFKVHFNFIQVQSPLKHLEAVLLREERDLCACVRRNCLASLKHKPAIVWACLIRALEPESFWKSPRR